MRKMSSGMTRQALVLQTRLQGLRLPGAPGSGRVVVTLPPALIRLLGWHVGQHLKWQVTNGSLKLSLRKSVSAPARKRSGAERIRFERRWQAALRDLQRQRHRQGWTIVKNTGLSV